MRSLRMAAALISLLAVVAGCGDDDPGTVRLLTHESFLASEDILAEFTETTGYELEIIQGSDAGSVVNQAILAAGNPVADVLFGVDTTFLSRAINGEIFDPYRSPALGTVDPALAVDPDDRVTPIDFGDVCLNYDKAAFGLDLPVPQSLGDLTEPAYRDLLVVEDPATSSPGLAFMLATIAVFGEGDDGSAPWLEFWEGLKANGVEVVSGWEEAYYGSFSGSGTGGTRPLVVSYASSPPAAVIFSEEPLDDAPTGVITDGCFRQIEFAGILRGAENRAGAEALIDFMLSRRFQEDVPLNMFVFPAVTDAALPDEFVQYTVIPDSPAGLDPVRIEEHRERWIAEWAEVMLR